ncbi:LOW QUALITY PROTEIN: hepcidin [Suncus etruscus]|uniref:LOW QUALITY PROTEIN: hepcidin n=1 Tax=Suncus etruscus TaxID=109475 RepID=UPI0021101CFC|nr:LOW QUALITY PROTEIN: hepcidin [Suncus etruscus]
MVRNAQAACLLLLLLASLASTAILSKQANQQTELQSMDSSIISQKDFKVRTRGALGSPAHPLHACHSLTDAPSPQSLFPKRWKRDSHFSICVFCCNCCHKTCGICCKT